jgi:hypothetical protein
MKYFVYFALFVLIIYLIKIREDFSEDNETSITDILPFENVKIPNVPIPKIPILKKGERYELLDMPYCDERFRASYSSNTNNIVNDGSKIYQDMTKPYEQKAEIGNKPQGLTQISWKKSYFSYNEKPVPLELQFTHVSPATGKVTKVIFPLGFTPETQKKAIEEIEEIEQFANASKSNPNKKLIRQELESSSKSSFEKLGELNTLIKTTSDVPEKIPGKVNVGQLLSFDLCEPAALMLDQRKFFFATTAKDELLLIAKPQIFSRNVGLKIMSNLDEPDEDLVLPETK